MIYFYSTLNKPYIFRGLGYTCRVADVGCFISVSVSTLNGQVQDFLMTTKPVAIRASISTQLEEMLTFNRPINIPLSKKLPPPNVPKKAKWSLLLNKQKLKIQVDGKTQNKYNWGDSITGKSNNCLDYRLLHFEKSVFGGCFLFKSCIYLYFFLSDQYVDNTLGKLRWKCKLFLHLFTF